MSSAPRAASIRTGRPALAWQPAAVSAQASSSGVLTRNATADGRAPMAARKKAWIHAHEHLALRQVGAVYLARRVRPGAQLEHHRHQPQTGHRVPHCLPLSGQFLQRGTHKDPQPLVGRADQIRLGHHSTA